MAGLDAGKAKEKPPNDAALTPPSPLSLEANPGPPGRSHKNEGNAALTGDRGHSAHAGDDHAPGHKRLAPHTPEVTTTGIDLSEFQKTIDWSKVPSAGVKFAYIRATDGTTIQDANFVQNWQGAEKAGILVGPYHYFTTTSAVDTQITNFVNTIKQVDSGNLPPVLDVENAKQFAKYTVPQRVAMIQQWLDGVQKATGVQPMLYMSSNFSAQVLNNAPQFDKYKLWVADYTTDPAPIVPQPWKDWDFWQHWDKGKVAGITGPVDLDLFHGPEASLPVLKPTPSTPPETPPAVPPEAPPKSP